MNAAIQAAQAGQYGAGFMVVADEIHKLSLESLKTAVNIETLIAEVEIANKTTLESSKMAYKRTEDQAEATRLVEKKIDDLKTISEELMKIAKEL